MEFLVNNGKQPNKCNSNLKRQNIQFNMTKTANGGETSKTCKQNLQAKLASKTLKLNLKTK